MDSSQRCFNVLEIVLSIAAHLNDRDRRSLGQVNRKCNDAMSMLPVQQSITETIQLGIIHETPSLKSPNSKVTKIVVGDWQFDTHIAERQLTAACNNELQLELRIGWLSSSAMSFIHAQSLSLTKLVLKDGSTLAMGDWMAEAFVNVERLVVEGRQSAAVVQNICQIYNPKSIKCLGVRVSPFQRVKAEDWVAGAERVTLERFQWEDRTWPSLRFLSLLLSSLDDLPSEPHVFPNLETLELRDAEVIKCTRRIPFENLKTLSLRYSEYGKKLQQAPNLTELRPTALTSVQVDCEGFQVWKVDEFFRQNRWPESVTLRGNCTCTPSCIHPVPDYLPTLTGCVELRILPQPLHRDGCDGLQWQDGKFLKGLGPCVRAMPSLEYLQVKHVEGFDEDGLGGLKALVID